MILVDANAILTFLIDFLARGKDGRLVRVRRHNRGPVAAAVEEAKGSGELAIADTAADEVRRTAKRAAWSAAKSAGATEYDEDEVVGGMLAELDRLRRHFGVGDNPAYVEKAGGVYTDAWTDERMQGAIEVRRLAKEGHERDASMPTPEKNEGDFVILSTAAYWAARGYKVQLLTFDQDFVAFSIAIRERLGVDIVDCGRLGRE